MLYRDWVIRHCSHWPSVHPERSSWWRSEWDTLSSGKTGRTELQIAGYFQENLIFYEPICLHLSIFRKALKSLTKIIVPQRLAATFYWDLYLVACTSFTKIIYIYTHTDLLPYLLKQLLRVLSEAVSQATVLNLTLSKLDTWLLHRTRF